MQGYGTAPPRVAKVKGEDLKQAKPAGVIGKAMGKTPIRQDANRVSVRSHTRAKTSKTKRR